MLAAVTHTNSQCNDDDGDAITGTLTFVPAAEEKELVLLLLEEDTTTTTTTAATARTWTARVTAQKLAIVASTDGI